MPAPSIGAPPRHLVDVGTAPRVRGVAAAEERGSLGIAVAGRVREPARNLRGEVAHAFGRDPVRRRASRRRGSPRPSAARRSHNSRHAAPEVTPSPSISPPLATRRSRSASAVTFAVDHDLAGRVALATLLPGEAARRCRPARRYGVPAFSDMVSATVMPVAPDAARRCRAPRRARPRRTPPYTRAGRTAVLRR